MRIILFGSPGVGKGTQAKILSKKFRVRHISTGDILREAVAHETELGRKARSSMDEGRLVPDEIMIALIRDVITDPRSKDGFILDGFPRTLTQAKALEELFQELRLSLNKVINIEVKEEEIVHRLSSRWMCRNCRRIYSELVDSVPSDRRCPKCGGELYQRKDDKPETVRHRLNVYMQSTLPIKEFYRKKGLLVDVNGMGDVGSVTDRILALLNHERS